MVEIFPIVWYDSYRTLESGLFIKFVLGASCFTAIGSIKFHLDNQDPTF